MHSNLPQKFYGCMKVQIFPPENHANVYNYKYRLVASFRNAQKHFPISLAKFAIRRICIYAYQKFCLPHFAASRYS